MHLPYELFLALRYLRFHRGRTFLSVITLISVAGVGVGAAALVIALALMAGFVDSVHEMIYSSSAHLTVMSAADPLFEDAEELLRRTEAVEGVRAAAPVLFTPAMLTLENLASPGFAQLHGIDPRAHARVVDDGGSGDDPFQALEQPAEGGREGIVLGADLARQIGVVEGDLVRVLVPKVTLSPWAPVPRSQVFEVRRVHSWGHYQQDSQQAYIRLSAARRLLRAGGATSWIKVRLDDLALLRPLKRRLAAELGDSWQVVDLIEQNSVLLKALNTEKLTLFLAIGLIVLVAALNIVSTLILMVNDKVKEIGTLTAMGARPQGIAAVFMLQGAVIGAVGTVVGLLLGWGVAYWLDRSKLIELNPEVYFLSHVPFSPQPLDLFFVGLSALVISFLATVYPALKAARLDPLEAIRHE